MADASDEETTVLVAALLHYQSLQQYYYPIRTSSGIVTLSELVAVLLPYQS